MDMNDQKCNNTQKETRGRLRKLNAHRLDSNIKRKRRELQNMELLNFLK